MQIVYSIGHSKHPIEKFLGLLNLHAIKVLVDVRTNPMSRFSPQFNKKRLEQSLAEAGVEYVYLGTGLGGRPKGEQFYDENGNVVLQRIAQSQAFQNDIKLLLERIELASQAGANELDAGKRVAVMCSEEDPAACHRKTLIGKALAATPGITMRHIRGDGSAHDELLI